MFRKGQVRTINLSNFRVRFWFEKKTIKTNRAAPTCNNCLKGNNIKISMILKEKITKISMIYNWFADYLSFFLEKLKFSFFTSLGLLCRGPRWALILYLSNNILSESFFPFTRLPCAQENVRIPEMKVTKYKTFNLNRNCVQISKKISLYIEVICYCSCFLFSSPKLPWTILGKKIICLLFDCFYLTHHSSKQIICFDSEKSAIPVVFYVPWVLLVFVLLAGLGRVGLGHAGFRLIRLDRAGLSIVELSYFRL